MLMKVGYQTFPSGKQYLYVEEPDTSTRIFLRNILFLKHASNPSEIVVVREWGAKTNQCSWEPPKGQMEWKEMADSGVKPNQMISDKELIKHMRTGVLREISEEAKIKSSEIKQLRILPLSYTEAFPKAGPTAKFRYQFWEGVVHDLRPAQARMRQLTSNPDLAAILPADVCEKDAVEWWSPSTSPSSQWKRIRGKFSMKMTQMYFASSFV